MILQNNMVMKLFKLKQTKTIYIYYLSIIQKYLLQISLDNLNNIARIRCGNITMNIYLIFIGNTKHFGQTDILLVA